MSREYVRQSGACACSGCGAAAAVKGMCVPHYKQSPRYKALQAEAHRRHRNANPHVEWAKAVVCAARHRCAKNGTPFAITVDYVASLGFPSTCPVFPHVALDYLSKGARGCRDNAPSLDRIDGRLGYVPGNVRIISMRANRMKSDATIEERELLALDARSLWTPIQEAA